MVPKSFEDKQKKLVFQKIMLGNLIRLEENIKRELKRHKLTPQDLSVISGVSIKTIRKLLDVRRYAPYNPQYETLLKIALALDCRLSDLVRAPKQ